MVGAALLALPAAAQTDFIPINPRATYLRTNNDPSAQAAVPIDLHALSFPVDPGDSILLERIGDFSPFAAFGDNALSLLGVFSASSTLLPASNQSRVVDAIDAGTDFTTAPTAMGALPTDIPQDFAISTPAGSPASVLVQVPAGARFLFTAPHDSFFGDNTDPNGNYGLRITAVAPAPGPGHLELLVGGGICVAVAGLLRGRRARAGA